MAVITTEGTPDLKPKSTTQASRAGDGKAAQSAEVLNSAMQKTVKTTPEVTVKEVDADKATPAEKAKLSAQRLGDEVDDLEKAVKKLATVVQEKTVAKTKPKVTVSEYEDGDVEWEV